MPHYNANTIHKEFYSREIRIGYNIEFPRFIDWCFYINKMLVIAVAGKIYHIVVHISLANCTDPLCPVFQACLVCQNAADFDDDTCLDLKRRFHISF